MHLDTVLSVIYPIDTQLDCSKNVKIYIKIYMRGAATCFGFSHPSSRSYCMCFAEDICIISLTPHSALHTHTNKDGIHMQPLDRTESVGKVKVKVTPCTGTETLYRPYGP